MGDNVHLGPGSILKAVVGKGKGSGNRSNAVRDACAVKIRIGNRVSATSSLHLAASSSIVIEDDVLLASNIFIADVTHSYADATVPYKDQGLNRARPVTIGRGSWLGQNVVVMPGVTIGSFSIIGANSVVTRSVPDRCIAVGVPARVIRIWDSESGAWAPVTEQQPLRSETPAW